MANMASEFKEMLEAKASALLEAGQKKNEWLTQQLTQHCVEQFHQSMETVKAAFSANLRDQEAQALGAVEQLDRLMTKQLGNFIELFGQFLATTRIELAHFQGTCNGFILNKLMCRRIDASGQCGRRTKSIPRFMY